MISLYVLMQDLLSAGYTLVLDDAETSSDLYLFKKNFVVMNALYQIKMQSEQEGFQLIISSLKIGFINQELIQNKSLNSLEDIDISADKSLAEYYLNWNNYDLADDQSVENLLNSFWNHYAKYNNLHKTDKKRLDAFSILGVESSASWKHIQQAYRKLITAHHPDKGGSGFQFIKIREAYLLLKFMRSKTH